MDAKLDLALFGMVVIKISQVNINPIKNGFDFKFQIFLLKIFKKANTINLNFTQLPYVTYVTWIILNK